ncbi:MAG: hypothetical protein U9N11_00935 [Campylobacterota bacterium]|nr:hypothetical protein [Campylobacterota bacterium]
MVDVGYRYYNGDIGGYYAAGLTGMAIIGGGGAVKGFEAARKGYRLFNSNGTLTNLGLNNSKDIMNYAKLTRNGGNSRLQLGYSKYTTKPYSASNGKNVETHFYADPNSGTIDYTLDYKTKLSLNYWE